MWVKKVSVRERRFVSQAVVQLTRKGTYLTVQDKHGAILGTAKWEGRKTFEELTAFLAEDKLLIQHGWRKPREGVYIVYLDSHV